MGIYLFLHLTIISNILDLVEAMSCQKLLNWIHNQIWYVYSTYNANTLYLSKGVHVLSKCIMRNWSSKYGAF